MALYFNGLRTYGLGLTNAEILALPTTRVLALIAPPAGTRIKLVSVSLYTDFAAGAYTNINTAYATLQLETTGANWIMSPLVNDSTAPGLTNVSDVFGTTNVLAIDLLAAPTFPHPNGWQQWVCTTPRANVDGDAVYVAFDNNGSGNLTGGHANNSAVIRLYYFFEALAAD